MRDTLGYIPVSSEFLDVAELEAVVIEYARVFESAGLCRLGEDDVPHAGGLVVFVVTGGTERRMLELVSARHSAESVDRHRTSDPVLLVAYPGRNSLPAALEVLARLQQDGVAGRIVFLDGPGDEAGIERLRAALDASAPDSAGVAPLRPGTDSAVALGALRLLEPACRVDGRRIGLVGPPSDWLVASSPGPSLVREIWGADVVEIGMGELRARVDAAEDSSSAARGGRDAVGDFAESFRARASEVREPSDEDLRASGAIYVALRSLVDELELDAVTVRCFDLVTERGATGCLALSRLADEGVVAGCEGDLVSALGMLWVRERLGQTSWMANPARVDASSNTLWLAHCTVPGCMVSGYVLRSHFESGLGAAVQGSVPTGPVTLLRIGGRDLDRVWMAEGEIASRGTDEAMCRTQVEVVLRDRRAVADLLERPLGNHLVLTRGWVADRLG